METLRVVMANGTRRIELEGAQEIVREYLNEMRAWMNERTQPRQEEEEPVPGSGAGDERLSLRSFIASKSPSNKYEAMAVLLSYKQRFESKEELSVDEIRNTMIQAGVRPPGAMAQAMADCRRRYGYVEASKTKGHWSLSAQGETLVEIDLPRAKN